MTESLATEQKKPNQSFLSSFSFGDDTLETMIEVDQVSMIFNMAAEQLNSLKEYAISFARHELKFKEFRALDNVSLTVKRGDVFGIMGTNGSGKSTLLKIIAGVLDPSEGTCTINGSIAPLIELGAGFDLELTARENIYLNGALLGYPKEFIDQHFEEIVNFAEIRAFLDMPMKNYSSGMVARVAFAIATVIVPDILIVDEVLSVGDFMFQQKCERRIQSLIRDYGVTVLIVSHNSDQIERLCNKAIWIEKGHTRMIGPAKSVCETYRIIGGHTGSEEAEQRVYELIDEADPNDLTGSQTFMGDNRYSVSVKILEQIEASHPITNLVVAPGENVAACILANIYASAANAPILLTQSDRLPDMVAQKIKTLEVRGIEVFGDHQLISSEVISELQTIAPLALIHHHKGFTNERLAYELYTERKHDLHSKKAILTYDACFGDLLCMLPYACNYKVPVFFNIEDGRIAEDVLEELSSGAFDEVLLLGGQISFPDQCLEPLQDVVKITRFCGKSLFDANNLIVNWIEENTDLFQKPFETFLVSAWNPADALTVGPLILQRNGIVMIEDAQNLDSIANVLDFISAHAQNILELVFFGDKTQFSDTKKALLLTELSRARKQEGSHV